jgi:hypothetical protein
VVVVEDVGAGLEAVAIVVDVVAAEPPLPPQDASRPSTRTAAATRPEPRIASSIQRDAATILVVFR